MLDPKYLVRISTTKHKEPLEIETVYKTDVNVMYDSDFVRIVAADDTDYYLPTSIIVAITVEKLDE